MRVRRPRLNGGTADVKYILLLRLSEARVTLTLGCRHQRAALSTHVFLIRGTVIRNPALEVTKVVRRLVEGIAMLVIDKVRFVVVAELTRRCFVIGFKLSGLVRGEVVN